MIFQPICTCAVPGINGCTKHTYGEPSDHQPIDAIAHAITTGGAFTDEDAIRVAHAYLQQEGHRNA